MDHAEARTLASARADGEAVPAEELDQHLASCDMCSTFASGLQPLHLLTLALPRERAVFRFEVPVRRRRVAWFAAPAIAVALVVAVLFVTVLAPLPQFTVQAGAAQALERLSTLYVQRDVTDTLTGVVTHETIWYKAPSFVRIERVQGSSRSLEIDRPGERYLSGGGTATLSIDAAPSLDVVPEPLSATLAFYGAPAGPGPTIAGRPTTRMVLDAGNGQMRIAYVDAERYVALGGETRAVLGKTLVDRNRVVQRKTTLDVRYNQPIASALFDIPAHAPISSGGFRHVGVRSLHAAPHAVPAGFKVVTAGRSLDGDAALFARGALPVLVQMAPNRFGSADVPEGEVAARVSVSGRDALLLYGLYSVPRVTFVAGGYRVTVSSFLPRDALLALAAAMYPA